MSRLQQLIAGLVALGTIVSISVPILAQDAKFPTNGIINDSDSSITKDTPLVVIKADGYPLDEVLKDVCRKAHWGLVLNASAEVLRQPVTVLLPTKKPAGDVVNMVLFQKPLQAYLENDVLHVVDLPAQKSATPTAIAEPVIESHIPVDTDSKEIVINGFDELKKFKTRFKDKIRQHKEKDRQSNNKKIERVEIGQEIQIGADEKVHKAVSIGDNVTIEGSVEEEAVAVGGNMTIKKGAHVGTDAVAIGGDVLIESGAVVEGEAVAVGGKVSVEDGAVVEGDRVSVNIPLPSIGGITSLLGMGAVFWILAAILRSFVILAVALIIVWLAPSRVNIAKEYLTQKTGLSLFSGLLILLGAVPIIVLLAMTIIGIPLIPFFILFLVAVTVFGLAALLSWLGYWAPIFKNKKSPTGAIIIGFFIFLIINMIPVLGGIFLLIASLAAAGATFLSRFGKKSRAL